MKRLIRDMQNSNSIHIERLLTKLLTSLEAKVPEQAASLKPGLSKSELSKFIRDIPFPIPSEIQQLYQWKNGGSFAIRGAGIVDVAIFYSLEESLAHLLVTVQGGMKMKGLFEQPKRVM